MIRAQALGPGAVVRIVAPAGPFEAEVFAKGIAVLKARGYEPRFGEGLRARAKYLAGCDDRRIAEWNEAARDPDAQAIFAARGGFGTMRILDRIDPAPLLEHPKIIVGFSDITALHGVFNRAGLVTLHGPVVTQLSRLSSAARERLFASLESATDAPSFRRLRRVVRGKAVGRLLGGNLTLLAHLAGTKFFPRLKGSILFLEDVGETPYRLDRCFQSLRLRGALDGVAGFALGYLTRCDEPGRGKGREVLEECLRDLGIPAVSGVPAGHEDHNLALPLGTRVRLDADAGTLEFCEGAVR